MSRFCEGHLKIDRWIGNSLISIYEQAACSPLILKARELNLIVSLHSLDEVYGWLQKKRELSEKVLSDFIKFL
jgi:hypothetical protein